jgi:hypothetical protein
VLFTLAAAGRNPTDILIPTQAGTEGSGGDDDEDDDVAGGATFSALATGGDDKPSSHEVSMNAERKPPTVATPKPVVDEPRPVDQGMKIEYNHPIPPKTISCEGNAIQFLVGCSMVSGGLFMGPFAPFVVLKGLDEMQAGISGKGTIVYNKALEAGLSERGAFIVDFATSCPDLFFALSKGLFKGAAKVIAETAPRSGSVVLFEAGELGSKAVASAAESTAEAMARNPNAVAAGASKILAPNAVPAIPRAGRMHVEPVELSAGEAGRDFVIPGRSTPETFSARLMDGSKTLEVTWTESLGQGPIAGRLAQAQELAGGPGSFTRITGKASDNLQALIASNKFDTQQASQLLGQRLGGKWQVEVTPRPNGTTWNITATRIGD